jgi:hypothetical protein
MEKVLITLGHKKLSDNELISTNISYPDQWYNYHVHMIYLLSHIQYLRTTFTLSTHANMI